MVLAVSGVKNSGKTTLIEGVIPHLKSHGLHVAVIKHDGHDFDADVPGRDSHRHRTAGAYGTAVFSDTKIMIIKEQHGTRPEDLIACFPEADIILLEGFKYSSFPKLEVLRECNGRTGICPQETVLAYAADFALATDKTVFRLDAYEQIADWMIQIKGE